MNGARQTSLKIGIRCLSVIAWLTVAGIPISLAVPGCQGRECESDGYKDYGYGPGEGHLVDANTWESTPNVAYSNGTTANWLPFGPYHLWGIHPVGLEGRDILTINVYYSADPNPNAAGSNFTIGAGNGAIESVSADSRTVFVSNATCAPTYVRIVIQADPLPPAVPAADAGVGPAINVEAGLDSGASDLDAGDLDAADASD